MIDICFLTAKLTEKNFIIILSFIFTDEKMFFASKNQAGDNFVYYKNSLS